VDVFVYFSHHLVTVPPPGWIHAAHKHGVKVRVLGCVGVCCVPRTTRCTCKRAATHARLRIGRMADAPSTPTPTPPRP
jgi:hypothetical protein